MAENGTAGVTEPPGGKRENSTAEGENDMSTALSEQLLLVERKRRVSIKTASVLRRYTIILSWVSVVYLGIMGVVTLVLAMIDRNSTGFAFALDAFLDCVSSAVVIWRFSGTAAAVYSAKKERIACITLGSLFILSFISILARSMVSMVSHVHPVRSDVLWALSIVNTGVCLVFIILKSILAHRLESISLTTDAVNSVIGFIMAFAAVLSDWAYNQHESVWYVDPLIGILCSVFLLIYGVWVIVYEVCFAKTEEPAMEMAEQ